MEQPREGVCQPLAGYRRLQRDEHMKGLAIATGRECPKKAPSQSTRTCTTDVTEVAVLHEVPGAVDTEDGVNHLGPRHGRKVVRRGILFASTALSVHEGRRRAGFGTVC